VATLTKAMMLSAWQVEPWAGWARCRLAAQRSAVQRSARPFSTNERRFMYAHHHGKSRCPDDNATASVMVPSPQRPSSGFSPLATEDGRLLLPRPRLASLGIAWCRGADQTTVLVGNAAPGKARLCVSTRTTDLEPSPRRAWQSDASSCKALRRYAHRTTDLVGP
jgi:hypothetical protein